MIYLYSPTKTTFFWSLYFTPASRRNRFKIMQILLNLLFLDWNLLWLASTTVARRCVLFIRLHHFNMFSNPLVSYSPLLLKNFDTVLLNVKYCFSMSYGSLNVASCLIENSPWMAQKHLPVNKRNFFRNYFYFF